MHNGKEGEVRAQPEALSQDEVLFLSEEMATLLAQTFLRLSFAPGFPTNVGDVSRLESSLATLTAAERSDTYSVELDKNMWRLQ